MTSVQLLIEGENGFMFIGLFTRQAENSALMLANESQREAYERCLDEVANHVVQALLNQKDLREECIKLKMLVFDLERQNRALCELFQQKLPNHPNSAQYQVNTPQAKVLKGNGHRTQHSSPGPRGSATSMDALSPFFKKKAHILEVLRKMEETDPLKFHPSTTSLSFCDYSQVLMSTEAVLASADPLPLQCKSHHTACHCSRPDADAHQHATSFCAAPHPPSSAKDSAPISHCDTETSNGLAPINATWLNDPSAVPEKDTTDEDSSVRASASVSPSPSCLSDVKAAAINSPSKLLKFLKIPSIGEKTQASTPAVRLSPQLTRNSRIPCRTNNYEVYHSPVPTRRATTTERCRQPPPPPSRSESYPTTHSAPTSPPQSEDIGASPAPSSSSSPKVTQSIPHYENVCELSVSSRGEDPTKGQEKRTTLPSLTKANGGERKLIKSLPESSRISYSQTRQKQETDIVTLTGSAVAQQPPPPPTRRTESSSIPKRPTASAGRSQADSSHIAFKDRLAALGKLRSSEDLQVGIRPVDTVNEGSYLEERNKAAETQRPSEILKEEHRHSKQTDSIDGKPKGGFGGLKYQGTSQLYEQPVKSHTSGVKQELKPEAPKSKIGLPSPNADAPQVLRNHIKCPGSLNLPYNIKSGVSPHSSNSPNKIPPKSPSKPSQGPSVHRGGKPSEAPRYSSKSEERTKISSKGKKNPMYGDSLPPPPPRPPTVDGERPIPPVPSPQSAIEQKVMKGIEENMLKLQEQDKVGQCVEVKQKTSNGIASWFGLKKSKLPALSRKTDATKTKDEKKEWKINIPSVGRDSVKMATKCKEGVEGLNISTLMEKAEGLRRALEEERAYVERSGRGHSCEVVMDQSQGQLAVMYRGGRSMGLSDIFNCMPFCSHFLQGTERIGKITSDENLADSVNSQHFAGSGASTYTLDSGIGTFPLPDCSSGAALRGLSKTRAVAEHHSGGSPGRAGRRARTLERDLTSQEENYPPHKHLVPSIQYGSGLEGRSSAGVIHEGANNHTTLDII
uniref:Nck-associated protein 5 C-terminal domain-containing protein n=1 Tax=Gouania willdenowi TaxID=441366 RepID=A0A8C5GEN6_GOUWI